jgi:radical SAM superfamily enzyme YgiQ (UPF0313 family)
MNILLVAPRIIDNDGDTYVWPIGITCISAILKREGFNVFCLNMNHIPFKESYDVLKNMIVGKNIDIVGCGGFSFHCKEIKAVFDAARNIRESILTIVGGSVITTEPIIMSEFFSCDYGVVGEGEATIVDLVRNIQSGMSDPVTIKGIVYKSDNGYVFTGDRLDYVDIETLPIPDYKGFGFQYFLDSNSSKSIGMFASRSCPFKCTFCSHSTGDKYRRRSVKSVIDEIKYYIEEFQVNFVGFFDDVLFTTEDRMSELCDEIAKLNIKFAAQLRVDVVNEPMLKKLKNAGCISVSYGLESHSQKILDSMKKHITTEQIDRALHLTYEAELDIQGNFIFGDPQETMETFKETLMWHYKNRKYHINIVPIFTAPGAEIYEKAKQKNLIPDVLDFIIKTNYEINLTSMLDEEYRLMKSIIATYSTSDTSLPYDRKEAFLYSINDPNCISIITQCEHCGNIDHDRESTRMENIKRVTSVNQRENGLMIKCGCCNRRYEVIYNLNHIVSIENILSKVKTQDLYIWGTSQYSWYLYQCINNFINIPAFIDGFESKKEFFGVPVIYPDEFMRKGSDVIIAFTRPQLALNRIYAFGKPSFNAITLW